MKLNKDLISSAKKLRIEGNSISEISHTLGIPKTTVYGYVKSIELEEEVIEKLNSKRGGSTKRRINSEVLALKEGEQFVSSLNEKELILFFAALYWAEGNKKDFILTNTDPNLIKVAMYVLRHIFRVKDEDIQVSLRIYEDLDIDSCLSFWSRIVDIHKKNFTSIHVLKGKKFGKLKNGMCRIRVRKGGYLLRKIVGINKAVVGKVGK